ncbi:M1 family metallopeptidase [Acidobacteriota bacterium]
MKRRGFPRWLKILSISVAILLVSILALLISLGWYVKRQMLESGGALPVSLAAYDVRHYDLDVRVDPSDQRIAGTSTVTVEVLKPIDIFDINLDNRLEVVSVKSAGVSCAFRHADGVIAVELRERWLVGERHEVTIIYGGKPKVALRPPWINGFVWSETPSGAPWIGVTGQGDGGDNWWPCKDHPSDEPDEGMNISLTFPSGLVGLSNGRLIDEVDNGDGTVTTNWQVNYPINNYLVTVNIAPYVRIEERYHGIDGTLDEPLVFWAVPEYERYARTMWRQMPRILEVLGRRFGEYPFFDDKFAVAHAPYYGMEHQTVVAYGALFTDNDFGFDDLLLHEVAHEWWGNKITVSDWSDFWIQEGFATYAQALYVLDTLGESRYLDYMARLRQRIDNSHPVVQGKNLTSAQAYSDEIYFKGAWVLHSLRWLLGDEDFFTVVWRFANDPEYAYGLVSSQDLEKLVFEVSGREIDWFWARYLYRAEEPAWRVRRRLEGDRDRVTISWDDRGFEMPLPVWVAGVEQRVEMTDGQASILVDRGATVEIDPLGYVLGGPIS